MGSVVGGSTLAALVRGHLGLDVEAQVVGPRDALLLARSAVCLPGLFVETEDTVRHGVAGGHVKRLADAYAIRRPDAWMNRGESHMRCLCVFGPLLVAFCICDLGLQSSRTKGDS